MGTGSVCCIYPDSGTADRTGRHRRLGDRGVCRADVGAADRAGAAGRVGLCVRAGLCGLAFVVFSRRNAGCSRLDRQRPHIIGGDRRGIRHELAAFGGWGSRTGLIGRQERDGAEIRQWALGAGRVSR